MIKDSTDRSLPRSKKSIALICQHFYPEMISTGMHMTELAVGLARCGWSLRVYCTQPVYRDHSQSDERVPLYSEYQGIEIVRVPAWGNQRRSLLQRGINALLFVANTAWHLWRDRKQLSGVINTTNPPFLGLAAVFAKWFAHLPFITIVYDLFPDAAVCIGELPANSLVVRLWERLTRFLLRQSAGLVVIGRDMEQRVRCKLGKNTQVDIALIPNWSDSDLVYPVPREQNPFRQACGHGDHFVIQYSGRMGRTHNIEPLVDAARLLQDKQVIFQFIGDGAKRAKLEMQSAGLPNVQFLPYQPFDNLANVLSAADLAVVCLERSCTGISVPSKTYGIMASGRPILAFLSPESEIGQTILEAECGFVLPEPSGDQIAELILDCMQNPSVVKRMGCNSRHVFLKNYTLARAVDSYDKFLRRYLIS
jgi:glycosyltransferase involved in cell wall biosynthesis